MKYRHILGIIGVIILCAPCVYAQTFDTGPGQAQETELVIEDFATTGLGDSSSLGISVGGVFSGGALFDLNFDFFISPLVGLRLAIGAGLPFQSDQVTSLGLRFGIGATWRSYVINRVRFYGGVLLNGAFDVLTDFDLLLAPEGFGGFEIFASPVVSIFTEFGGMSSIPILNLNDTALRTQYTYADGFFFRIGTRFAL